MLLKRAHEGCNSTGLLTNGYIDTIDRLACLIETLLIDDGINGDGGLTSLTVANDELTLSSSRWPSDLSVAAPSRADGRSHQEPYGRVASQMPRSDRSLPFRR